MNCFDHVAHCCYLSGPHKCNATTIQLQYKNFFLVLQLYCICADPCNTMLQYKFSTSCRKLAGYLQQLQKTCIAVVLRLCGLLQYNKIFVLCYWSCIVVVLHLCGLLQYNKFFVLCYCSCIVIVRTALVADHLL